MLNAILQGVNILKSRNSQVVANGINNVKGRLELADFLVKVDAESLLQVVGDVHHVEVAESKRPS